jgi:DHA2 family multidrug resistance protein
LFDAFEPQDRPVASGLFGMGLVLGPTLGPTVGGYIIEHFNWPLIFMINIPIGIIATILAYTFVEKKPNEGKKKKEIHIDYTGIAFLMAGIGCLQFVLERGESEDWFSSNAIRICAVIAAIGIVGFIIYELSIKHPAVNLRVLNNRNLAFTTMFTFVAGFGLFTSVFVYPVLAQRVLGFTAYETGLSLLPPTLVGVIMMPIIGRVMSKGVSPIPFVIIGFMLFAGYAWTSADVSPDVNRWDFFFPLVLRALGLSLVNLPLINQAVVGLQPKEYAAGIALNNMIRQLGGAFGIAIANNYIANHYAQHRSDLVSNLTQGSYNLTNTVNGMAQNFIGKTGDSATAATKAYALISASVDKQSYYLSYLDTFKLIAIFFIIVMPLVVFLRTKKKANDNGAAAAALAEAH